MTKLDNIKRWAEDATYLTGLWITLVETGEENVTYHYLDEDDKSATKVVTYPELLAAVEHLAAGTFTNYDDTERPVWDYGLVACVTILRDYEEADYDAQVDDLIAQQAVLGKQIFG
jgi:hypothetical protein